MGSDTDESTSVPFFRCFGLGLARAEAVCCLGLVVDTDKMGSLADDDV